MLEFDSISVSSYEADTLAQQLTERSTAGWEVVSIVSAGSSVTAYLSRPAGSADTGADAAVSTPDATESAVEDFGGEETGPLGDADVAPSDGADVSDVFSGSMETPGEAWSPEPEPTDTSSTHDTPASFDAATSSSGWATTDGTDTPTGADHDPQAAHVDSGTSTPNLADDIAALASQIHDDDVPAATSESAGWAASSDTGTAEPTLPGSGAASEAAAEPAQEAPAEPQEPQQAAAAAAPAGWYADPSGRFELRYWDGGQWTEHVSRAGQQYTDPPVA